MEQIVVVGRTVDVLMQHCRTPVAQLAPRAAMAPGAAATKEERATTGRRRVDTRKNMLNE